MPLSVSSPTVRLSGRVRSLVLVTAALVAALLGALTANASAQATTVPKPVAHTAATVTAASASSCPHYYLCLYEGYSYGGTIHKLYNCQTYYTDYPIHSVVNNQSSGTRASFRDYNNAQFWVSPGAYWASSNTDGIAGSLNRAFYVKPC